VQHADRLVRDDDAQLSGRAARSRRATRSACSRETSPSVWRYQRVVLTVTTSTSAHSNSGSRSSPKHGV
jgi:hypothetical protein